MSCDFLVGYLAGLLVGFCIGFQIALSWRKQAMNWSNRRPDLKERHKPTGLCTWRYAACKLGQLARLQLGWDYATSKPMNPLAQANYLEWLSGVPDDLLGDAEPMLTDDGFIRLEWRRDGYVRIAEIGPASLFMASLTPNHQDDFVAEVDRFDSVALSRFFALGAEQPGVRDGKVIAGQWVPDEEADE